ncbi:NUDIX domain-containing protein [Flavobacterium sp. CBA20B-1]|uniref:NUDIX hydrolase n=1 Tax=unclassified Flavobacterium TaxID=196869 RepID=UPI00222514CA|nr:MULTISPECIES: NUDIX domain-containing protein [unclassified Flavobacterium]WCM41860.1 NUDIX domain-containing protein [Flavobacterium sp. CBA20B-1]
MYKVFINDKPLFLTSTLEKERNFKYYLLETIDLQKLIAQYFSGEVTNAYLYHPFEEQLMKLFKDKITVNKAGGGLVENDKKQVLFIFRNGKWDLPKGGIEKNETIEQTSIREVEEETGCKNLKINKRLEKTFHIFKRNGEYRLKITYWFLMNTKYKGNLHGQIEEGIEKVVWVDKKDIPELLKNSYQNIKLLFNDTVYDQTVLEKEKGII